MNSNQKFNNDLKQGNIGERIVANYLKNKGFNIIGFSNEKKYDIITDYNGKEKTFEVKTDLWEYYNKKVTNNLFIEVSCSGKPSGISSSQADYFIYLLPETGYMYMIKMEELRDLIRFNNFRKSTQSGDGGRSVGYLLNRDKIKEHFNIVKLNDILKYFIK